MKEAWGKARRILASALGGVKEKPRNQDRPGSSLGCSAGDFQPLPFILKQSPVNY